MKKKILIGFLICLLILTITNASEEPPEMCTDSDVGPEDGRNPTEEVLTTKGSTKYGIRTSKDICVKGTETDMYMEESPYLKEFYCDDNDQREFVIFYCGDYGYEKCVDGACIGTGTGTKPNQYAQRVIADCGNKIREKDLGEECDPPGSVCWDKDNYGMCQPDCSCKWHNPKTPEETEEELDEFDEEEQDELDEEDEEELESKDEEEDEEEEYLGERKDFENEPGIQVTKGIAGFFRGIWDWFIGLF